MKVVSSLQLHILHEGSWQCRSEDFGSGGELSSFGGWGRQEDVIIRLIAKAGQVSEVFT
jgi:hypothetical protein